MSLYSMLWQVASSSDDGLTMREILADIPHDPAAITVYVLIVISLGLVVWTGRSGRGGRPAGHA